MRPRPTAPPQDLPAIARPWVVDLVPTLSELQQPARQHDPYRPPMLPPDTVRRLSRIVLTAAAGGLAVLLPRPHDAEIDWGWWYRPPGSPTRAYAITSLSAHQRLELQAVEQEVEARAQVLHLVGVHSGLLRNRCAAWFIHPPRLDEP